MTVAEHPFDIDTRVRPTGTPGRFEAGFSPRCKALGGVINGGYAAAVSLSALRAALPHPDPLVVSTFFLRRGRPGPIEVHTEVANRGRRISTGQARILADGTEIVRTTASFTDRTGAAGICAELSAMPDLPPPGECLDPLADAPMPEVTITEQVEFRYPVRPGWFGGSPSSVPHAEFWIAFAGGRDADPMSLPLLVDAAAPVVLELGVAGSATVELNTHVRRWPAPGWLACRVATHHVADGYHEEDFELWDSRGHLVAQARQLAAVLRPAPRATESSPQPEASR